MDVRLERQRIVSTDNVYQYEGSFVVTDLKRYMGHKSYSLFRPRHDRPILARPSDDSQPRRRHTHLAELHLDSSCNIKMSDPVQGRDSFKVQSDMHSTTTDARRSIESQHALISASKAEITVLNANHKIEMENKHAEYIKMQDDLTAKSM